MKLALAYLAAFAVGSVVGSFLNVLVYRLPSVTVARLRSSATQSLWYLAWPLSFCPSCSEPIKPWDNIPIVSWLLLRGRSKCCGKPIAARYLVMELLAALVAVACLARFGLTPAMVWASVFCWLLLAIGCIDYQRYALPDILVQPLLWLGLLVNASGVFIPLHQAVFGAAAGYLVLFAVSEGTVLLLGRRMLGAGDPKLLAAIGAWIGWQLLPGALFIGAVSAVAFGVVRQLASSGRLRSNTFVAFGPHLALGGVAMVLFGFLVADLYLRS